MIFAAFIRCSVAKAFKYRLITMTPDFAIVLRLCGEVPVAVMFMAVSNLYTSVVYLIHKPLWTRSNRGLTDTD